MEVIRSAHGAIARGTHAPRWALDTAQVRDEQLEDCLTVDTGQMEESYRRARY